VSTHSESFFCRLLNISSHESLRIFIAWTLKFLIQTAIFLGATIITALFIERIGIEMLPFLFVSQAIFVMLGALLFAPFLRRFQKGTILNLGGGILFLLAVGAFFFQEVNHLLFFGLLLVAYSVVLAQMYIAMSIFMEDLFTPLESERAFPIIESAEPIAGIIAGFITAFGIKLSFVRAEDFLMIWGIIGICIIPLFFFFTEKLNSVPRPRSKKEEFERSDSSFEELQKSVGYIRNNPFLRSLFYAVLIQFAVMIIVEFLYTKSIETTFSSNLHSHQSVADALTHGFGVVNIILFTIVLFFQLFVASRTLANFGVVKTILLHPIMMFFSIITMTVSFSFVSATVTKGIYETFGGLQKNAYHSSFYVFRPLVRIRAKEFLEGFAKPIGIVIGTLLLFCAEYFFHGKDSEMILSLNIILIILTILRFFTSANFGENYTLLTKKNLETKGRATEKLDAIEILAQKGHKNASEILVSSLLSPNEKPEIQVKILKTLGILKDVNTIPTILKYCFEGKSLYVQITATKALGEFRNLGEHFLGQSFAKHRVIEALQTLFLSTQSKDLKSSIIKVFKNVRHPDVVPFLLKVLQSNNTEIVAEAIRACGMFHDMSAAYYLEPFLQHKNPIIVSNTIIAMWQFSPYRLSLSLALSKMLSSPDKKTQHAAVYAVGETLSYQEIPKLIRILEQSKDDEMLRMHCAIALAKMNRSESILHIIEMILSPKKEISNTTQSLFSTAHESIKKSVQQIVQRYISGRIHDILQREKTEVLEKMQDESLKDLYACYEILGEEKEMMEIIEILEEREESSPLSSFTKKNSQKKKDVKKYKVNSSL
jgi:HEAT repeat protein